jgi:maleate isomerase
MLSREDLKMESETGKEGRNAEWLRDSDFGWRARLGLMHPSRGWTPEHEWPRMLPRGVSYLVARIMMFASTLEGVEKMAEYELEAAKSLATANIDLICYGCTIGSMLKGAGYDKTLAANFQKATGVPTKTMTTAVIEAFHELNVRRIVVATPYVAEINKLEKAFLESNGFEVIYEKGLGITDTIETAKLSPAVVYRFGKEVFSKAPEADILFLSCGNLRTIEVLSVLEKDLGKPVISSNQALLWSALREVGVKESIHGFGSLLERPR